MKLSSVFLVGLSTALATVASATPLFAPYQYYWSVGNSQYYIKDLNDVKTKTPLQAVTLAFVIGNVANHMADDIPKMIPQIKDFQASGRQVIISVGGANGPFLEDILSETDLFNSLDSLVAQSGVRYLDFDVEGASVAMPASIAKRNKVLVKLQHKYPDLKVSFTLALWPAIHQGDAALTNDAVNLVKQTVQDGVKIHVVNGMAMDYYSPLQGVSLGQIACNAAVSIKNQLKPIYPSKSDAELFTMVGITPMIGINDNAAEVFQVEDARTLARCAKSYNIGLVSMWALQRDQVGRGSTALYSGVNTNNLDFVNTISSTLK